MLLIVPSICGHAPTADWVLILRVRWALLANTSHTPTIFAGTGMRRRYQRQWHRKGLLQLPSKLNAAWFILLDKSPHFRPCGTLILPVLVVSVKFSNLAT